jgi:hypothetical protein
VLCVSRGFKKEYFFGEIQIRLIRWKNELFIGETHLAVSFLAHFPVTLDFVTVEGELSVAGF